MLVWHCLSTTCRSTSVVSTTLALWHSLPTLTTELKTHFKPRGSPPKLGKPSSRCERAPPMLKTDPSSLQTRKASLPCLAASFLYLRAPSQNLCGFQEPIPGLIISLSSTVPTYMTGLSLTHWHFSTLHKTSCETHHSFRFLKTHLSCFQTNLYARNHKSLECLTRRHSPDFITFLVFEKKVCQ